MDIQAAVARAPRAPLSLETVTIEAPRPDEILVKVVATGICHTDISMRDRLYPVPQPIVLGHEGAGIVARIGAGITKVAPGDHVVMTFNSCGRCDSCNGHQPHYCHDFFGRNLAGARQDGTSPLRQGDHVVHGNFFGQSSFATYALCHERNIVKVRADAPLEKLGPLGCSVQTGAGAVIHALRLRPGQSLAVFGTGAVGLSAVMAARLAGASTIIAVDLNDRRLQIARELGAAHTINPERNDTAVAVRAILPAGVNCSFDTTGLAPVIRTAVEVLAPRGVCGMAGAAAPGTEVALDLMDMTARGKTLHGIFEGEASPDVFIPQLIDLHMQDRFPFDRLIQFYPFDQINQAIAETQAGLVVKPVLRMPG